MSGAAGPSRRRSFKATTSRPDHAPVPLTTDAMTLRKGETFHTPTELSSELWDPIEQLSLSPKRSHTSPSSLEDLVVDAGERRVAEILRKFDNVVGFKADRSDILKDNDVAPVPSFFVGRAEFPNAHGPDADDIKVKRTRARNHSHGSDSGLGSSVSGSCPSDSVFSSVTSAASAITTSISATSENHHRHLLSRYAEKQIKVHIADPILKNQDLKKFHRLVDDIPKRIESCSITNLRDLEKTLIFLAPDHSASPSAYQEFCEVTVRCIQNTVPNLSEADQRLPTDRPYTNHYFLDLVEQIRKYATMMAQAREKKARGEELDEMDYSPDETLKLEGGVTHMGEPLHFTRQKAGKSLPLASDQDRSAAKRSLSEDFSDDDGARRSMARRRKSDMPGAVMHVCKNCHKEFKRPCDLTKHEKTHSRPWKCPQRECRYHELGWPTEKERERHVNDKHAANPTFYHCQYEGCPYTSKRDSNCKQHMEKAHGWQYVRSKCTTGHKTSKSTTSSVTQPSPAAPFLPTPMTPALHTPPDVSAHEQPFINPSSEDLLQQEDPMFPEVKFSAPGQPSSSNNPEEYYDYGFMDPSNATFNYTPSGSASDSRRGSSVYTSTDMGISAHSHFAPAMFEEAMTANDPNFDTSDGLQGLEVPNSNGNFFQQPSPSTRPESANQSTLANLDTNLTTTSATGLPHISPGGNGDAVLYSPYDAGMQQQGGDFDLYPPASGPAITGYDMMPPLPQGQQNNVTFDTDMYDTEDCAIFGNHLQ